MKKFYLIPVFFALISGVFSQKAPNGDIWLHMLSTGQPAATKYLGDQLNSGSSWYINFEIGQDSWYQSDAGVGLSNSDPSGWTWRSASWYANGGGSNKQVRSDFGDFRFTSTGSWYFAGRAKAVSTDPWHYANSDGWGNASNFSPIYYFSVLALNNPGSQTAVVNGSYPTSNIDLSWSKDAQNHNVMIVRKKSFESWTEPTQGSAYTVGNSIGSGVVVYNSNGTSFTDTGLSSSTGYDYKFYSENYSYYSPGITSSTVTTSTATTDYFRSKTTGYWNNSASWESSFNNTHWVNASSFPSGSANSTSILNGHSISVSNTQTVNSLAIAGGASVVITAGNSLTVGGSFSNSGSASGLTVESGGSLITNSSVSGPILVKRNIASDNKWHFLSSPVSGQNICDGNFAPLTSNFNATTGVTFDFYKWSEAPVAGNLNWINLKNSDYTLNTSAFGATPQFETGLGYLVAYSSSFSGNTEKVFSGNPVSGDQILTLGTSGNTWNLLGNPFASAIDWDGVSKTSLVDGYYNVYNENKAGGAGYESYLDAGHSTSGANGKIAATQGFFVKASGSSITLPNSARVHNNNWMKSSNEYANHLKVRFGNAGNYDETFLIFEETGTNGKDFFDAEKLMSMDGLIPQVYSVIGQDQNLAINSMPFSLEEVSVRLGTTFPVSQEYYLEISGTESFPVTPSIVLEDTRLNQFQDLSADPIYTFPATALEDPDRFVLHFAGVTSVSEPAGADPIIVLSYDKGIRVINSGGSACTVSVIDLAGRLVSRAEILGNSSKEFIPGGPGSVYLVKVLTEKSTITKKVIVK